ncbi:hypothetical protein EJB05_13433, partial [Eragrostis curvula]
MSIPFYSQNKNLEKMFMQEAAMTSNLSILRASSSLNTTQQPEKRKIGDAWSDHAKRQRHSQSYGTAWLDSVPAPFTTPLPAVPSNAAAMAFPMVGVNGAAPRWTTAAALGASSRSAALPPPRMMAAANAPGAHVLRSLGAASAPQMAGVNNVAPLVTAHTAGELVPLPVNFYGYKSSAGGFPSMAAPAGGPPLAEALDSFLSTTLMRMLSALMPLCDPPLRNYERKIGAPPQWWPTASEPWWASEVAAHLLGMPIGPVPFVAGKLLNKANKVAVLVAIVKHLSPDFARITAATSNCLLFASEDALWNAALQNERANCMRRVQLQTVAAAYGHHQAGTFPYNVSITQPAANASQVVTAADYHGGFAPANGFQKKVANFPGNGGAQNGAMVATPTEPVLLPEQGGNLDATIFSGSDLGGQKLEDILKPFLPKQAERFGEGIRPSNAALAAKGEPEGRPWYKNEGRRHWFANMPFGSPHSYF